MHDVIIVGTGPAGLTAGLYAGRRGYDTLFLEKESIGGELVNRERIRHYPGFPDGVAGTEFRSALVEAVEAYDPDVTLAAVTGLEPGTPHAVQTEDGAHEARAVIVATGGEPAALGIPGEDEYDGMGVFHCAKCDGPLYRDDTVAVVGGGNNAVTDALLLTEFAEQVHVYEPGAELPADRHLREEVEANPAIDVTTGTAVTEVLGDDGVLTGLRVEDVDSGEQRVVEADGLYVHVGIDPNTEFLADTVSLADDDSVVVDVRLESDVEGVYAAGDVRQHSPQQVAAAVGDGVVAMASARDYIEDGGR
ncbi:MAG: NAD(P)/FAD-dependent oxidoreductase [Halobacteriales archaeon]